MSKLLTEQELKAKLELLCSLNMPIHAEHKIDKRNLIKALLPLFKSQKKAAIEELYSAAGTSPDNRLYTRRDLIAHADMVIGEDEIVDKQSSIYPISIRGVELHKRIRNIERLEQRERNK